MKKEGKRKGKSRQGILWRFNENESGQTIVFIGIILLTLAFFFALVVNTGHEVSRRLFIQNTCDAAALSGATWQARIMNIISLINIAMAIVLAIIIVLEAIGTALEIAYDVITGLLVAATVCCAIPYSAAACCPTVPGLETAQQTVSNLKDAYDDVVDPIIDALWKLEEILSDLEPPIVKASPGITILMSNYVAEENARLEDPTYSFGDIVVIPWPVPPNLPLEQGTIKDVCDYVRQYAKKNIVQKLPEVIDFLVDKIISAAISATCEGGSGNYSAELDAGDCHMCRDKINNGTATTVLWYVTRDTYAGWDVCENGSQTSHSEFKDWSVKSVPPPGYSWSDMTTVAEDHTLKDGTVVHGQTCCFVKRFPHKLETGWQFDDEDDDGDYKDPSEKYCLVEKWCLQKCKYEEKGTANNSAQGKEDKVKPHILTKDWKDKNSFLAITRYKKGKSLLLSKYFKNDIRSSTLGSVSFAKASFFFLGTETPDTFHLNWYSKLVRIEEDSDSSEIYKTINDAVGGITDKMITH